MGKHNKKRNIGLIHEQLIRFASEKIVDKNPEIANKAIDIVVKHFKNDSEMLREFKLFNALIYSRVDDVFKARRIIEESKRLSLKHDFNKLDDEKTKLIREINSTLNESNFYNQKIEDYKLFATVQTLLNEWRGAGRLGADELVEYETLLENHLLRPRNEECLVVKENADPLILNLMIEKFNSKYSDTLSGRQKQIVEAKISGDNELLMERMNALKYEVSQSIDDFFTKNTNAVLASKKKEITNLIESFSPSIEEEQIGKALILAQLLQELEEDER